MLGERLLEDRSGPVDASERNDKRFCYVLPRFLVEISPSLASLILSLQIISYFISQTKSLEVNICLKIQQTNLYCQSSTYTYYNRYHKSAVNFEYGWKTRA